MTRRNTNRIYTRTPPEVRFWRHVDARGPDECWLWSGGQSGNGYGRFRTGPKGHPYVPAHRFSYEMHIGPVPPGVFTLHKCDVRGCVNPKHLFLGDAGDNIRDCRDKGRLAGHFKPGPDPRRMAGSRHPSAKLTEACVIAIRADGRSSGVVAADYKVSPSLIQLIKRGKVWKHV